MRFGKYMVIVLQVFFFLSLLSLEAPNITIMVYLNLSHSQKMFLFTYLIIFPLCLILNTFYCYIFNFTSIFSCNVQHAINHIQSTFFLRLCNFYPQILNFSVLLLHLLCCYITFRAYEISLQQLFQCCLLLILTHASVLGQFRLIYLISSLWVLFPCSLHS